MLLIFNNENNLISCFIPGRPLVLETLHALMSNTKVVKEAMAKGKIHFLRSDISFKLKANMSRRRNGRILLNVIILD